MKLTYIDKFSGSRYGKRTPVGQAKGSELFSKFEKSPRWKLLDSQSHIVEKNDNRTDVYRGNTTIFEDIRNGKKVTIRASQSNTGKTINWVFSDDPETNLQSVQ